MKKRYLIVPIVLIIISTISLIVYIPCIRPMYYLQRVENRQELIDFWEFKYKITKSTIVLENLLSFYSPQFGVYDGEEYKDFDMDYENGIKYYEIYFSICEDKRTANYGIGYESYRETSYISLLYLNGDIEKCKSECYDFIKDGDNYNFMIVFLRQAYEYTDNESDKVWLKNIAKEVLNRTQNPGGEEISENIKMQYIEFLNS